MSFDTKDSVLRVAFAGGGTGGHIIPALTIAEGLKQYVEHQTSFTDVKFLFFGSKYGMENALVPQAGYELETLPIRGLSRSMSAKSMMQNLILPIRIIASIWQANRALARFNPHITIGTGGYASAIPVRQSLRRNISVVLQEQNSYPGLTTRLFAKKARKVFLTYPDAQKHLAGANIKITGNPVSVNAEIIPREEAANFFGLSPEVPTLFILGGSQGARNINRHFIKYLQTYLKKINMQVLWQTGKEDHELCLLSTDEDSRIKVLPFIHDMARAYSLTDLMVCRAGAMTLTEINYFGLPAILIPLPSAAANHQEYNARSLEKTGAARVLLEKDLNEGTFFSLLSEIFTDSKTLNNMASASLKMRKPEATETICQSIMEVIYSCA